MSRPDPYEDDKMDPRLKVLFWTWGIILFVMLAISQVFGDDHVHPPGHWMNRIPYRDPVTTELCCYFQSNTQSSNHCRAMDYRPERLSDGSYKLQDGFIVPKERVQWSRDYNFYECRHDDGHLLCFFAVPNGS